METSFSFEGESFEFDTPWALQVLGNVVMKLVEKIEDILKICGEFLSKQIPQRTTGAQNATNSNATEDCLEVPTISGLDDIAGLQNIKALLRTLVVLPRNQPQLFQNRRMSNSILLYGPPGTGKTRLVHGLAAECGASLHAVTVGTFLSSYVGETEKNIKRIFNYLRTTATFSILFIDEIDGLCRKRTSGEHEYSRRIKTELMCQLTKMDNCQNSIIIAATNCPWDLDSAILRRFQKRMYVPLPNSEERHELLQLFTKNLRIIQTPEQVAELIQLSEGYSGSDIAGLIQDALDIPLTELQVTTIWNKTSDGFYEPFIDKGSSMANMENVCIIGLESLPRLSVRARPITINDFLEAAKHMQVTVTAKDLDNYEKFKQTK